MSLRGSGNPSLSFPLSPIPSLTEGLPPPNSLGGFVDPTDRQQDLLHRTLTAAPSQLCLPLSESYAQKVGPVSFFLWARFLIIPLGLFFPRLPLQQPYLFTHVVHFPPYL